MAENQTPNPSAPTSSVQPKIVHKLALRTLVATTAMAALVFGLRWYTDFSKDPNRFGKATTAGAIAAVEFLDQGQQAVVIPSDGKILRSPDFASGNTERDVTWQPDGNQLFYVSDRDKNTFQVFRWLPREGGASEPRTIGTRGKSNPTFAPDSKGDVALICSGGVVLELDPVKKTTHQVLPPLSNEMAMASEDEGGGSTGQFTGIYGQLGEAFSRAQYIESHRAIAAIMKRDRGEVLIVQVFPEGDEKIKPPIPIMAGDKIYFSVAPDGTLAYSVLNFQWPTTPPANMIKNGKITLPFKNALGIFKLDSDPIAPIALSNEDKTAFGQIALSPDASKLLVVGGHSTENGFVPEALAVVPAKTAGAAAGAALVQGEIYEPSWDPSGSKIVYIKKESGRRAIYTLNADGSGETLVTPKGSFGQPVFSPQVATAK